MSHVLISILRHDRIEKEHGLIFIDFHMLST